LYDTGLRSHSAILREALRLQPTASTRGLTAIEDTVIGGGKYAIKADVPLIVISSVAMRDPAVWGEDADEFRPERMLDGKFEELPVCFLLKVSLSSPDYENTTYSLTLGSHLDTV
jgi:cytochrome P450